MKRWLFPTLGLLELLGAAALCWMASQLPGGQEVRAGFERARAATGTAAAHVANLRGEVKRLRDPSLGRVAEQLVEASRAVADASRQRTLDFATIQALRDATQQAGTGIGRLAAGVDPASVEKVADGLTASATLLEERVVPAATRAAEALENSSRGMQATASEFARVVRAAPLDLAPLADLNDGLGRFDEGLASVHATLDPRRLRSMREATEGAAGVATEGARLAERAAGVRYPVVRFQGLQPVVRSQPFWPEGAELSADLRKVASGVSAMSRELTSLGDELPRIQGAVAASRKAIESTRKVLATALANRTAAETVLKELPAQATRLAAELPRVTGELSRGLEATHSLHDLALALREAANGLRALSADWPQLREGLKGSAALLQVTSGELDDVLRNREAYEASRARLASVSNALSVAVAASGAGLDDQVDRSERLLNEFGASLREVEATLPGWGGLASRMVRSMRLFVLLFAAIVALHGTSLLASESPLAGRSAPKPLSPPGERAPGSVGGDPAIRP